MKRIILAALVGVLVSGPAWAGSREIEDCEDEIRLKLKFPGSYKREHVIKEENNEKPFTVKDGSPGSPEKLINSKVEIEFTVRNENNQVQRRVGSCQLLYVPGGIFSAKQLWVASVLIKYGP